MNLSVCMESQASTVPDNESSAVTYLFQDLYLHGDAHAGHVQHSEVADTLHATNKGQNSLTCHGLSSSHVRATEQRARSQGTLDSTTLLIIFVGFLFLCA